MVLTADLVHVVDVVLVDPQEILEILVPLVDLALLESREYKVHLEQG